MKHRLHPQIFRKKLAVLVVLLTLFCISQTSTQARLKYDPFEISNSPNNIVEPFYDQLGKMTADMWDYGQCDENCEKWVSQSKLTCGNSYIMDSYREGDQSILDEYAPTELGGSGKTDRSVTKISNYAHDACIQAQLTQNEAKLTADWPRQNARYNGQIGLASVCEGASSSGSYTPNACAAYGTNMGNFAHPIGPAGKIAANRPVVILFDIDSESPPPPAFLNASPLILRIVNVSHATSLSKMSERGSRFGAMFAGNDNVILVLGNEPNNPELEKDGGLVNYCEGIDIPSCGTKYVEQFNAFYTAVDNRVEVAAAPLDLLNAQYPATNFYTTARPAYAQADVLAANIYCNSDVTSCISGNQGFGFYGLDKEKVITEFGPNPPDTSVAEQVTFLEDNCSAATSVTSIVAPLIVNNCTSGGGDWLYYVNGELFDQSGSPQTATCSIDSNEINQQAQGSLYDFHQGSRPDKLYIPALQSRWAIEGPCKDIIRTQEEGEAYCDINPHCTNPSNICSEEGNCRSNYLVCKDLYTAMEVGKDFKLSTNMRQNAKNWSKIPPDLKKEINLITETKANVRGFVVVARDLEFTPTRCRWGVLCKRQEQELPLEVVDLVLPGVEGASHGAENDAKDTMLPKTYDQTRSQVIRDAGKIYPETCPTDCELISQDVCESLDLYVGRTNVRGEEYTQADVSFYKRLVNRICSGTEQLKCEGAPTTAQETGAKVNARPSKQTISQRLAFFIRKVGGDFQPPEDQPTTRMWFIADEATSNLGGYAQAYLDGFSMPTQTKGAGNESPYTNAYNGLAEAETNRVQRPTQIACSVATDPNCPATGYYTEVEEAYIGFRERHKPTFDSVGANDTTEHYEVEGVANAQIPLWWQGDRSAQSGQSWADEVGCKLPRVASILRFVPRGCRSSAPNSNIPNNNQQACDAKQHLFEPSCSGTVCYEAILARTLTQTQCKGKVLNPYYAIAIALNENGGLIATDTQGTNVKHFGCDPFGNTSYPTTIDGKLTCMLNTFTSYCESGKSQAESLSTYGYVPSNKLDGIINTLGGNDTNLYVSAAQAQSYAQSLRFHLNSTAGRDLWRRYYQPVVNDYQNNCEQ